MTPDPIQLAIEALETTDEIRDELREWSAACAAAWPLPESNPHDLVLRVIRDLERALAALKSAGWQTMDSAPRDGTEVDLWIDHVGGAQHRQPACHFHCEEWLYWGGDPEIGWLNAEELDSGVVATHWRPLPPPPAEESAS